MPRDTEPTGKKPKKSKKKEKEEITPIDKLNDVEEEVVKHEPETPKQKDLKKSKLTPMKIEQVSVKISEAQHAENIEGPQFMQLKLKKPAPKPKQEPVTTTLPKFQLKSRIKYVNDWPPHEEKPVISFLGSVRQNGDLSRNIKEAAKIKKKPLKLVPIPDLEKVELEKPEQYEFTPENLQIEEVSELKHDIDRAIVEEEKISPKLPVPKDLSESTNEEDKPKIVKEVADELKPQTETFPEEVTDKDTTFNLELPKPSSGTETEITPEEKVEKKPKKTKKKETTKESPKLAESDTVEKVSEPVVITEDNKEEPIPDIKEAIIEEDKITETIKDDVQEKPKTVKKIKKKPTKEIPDKNGEIIVEDKEVKENEECEEPGLPTHAEEISRKPKKRVTKLDQDSITKPEIKEFEEITEEKGEIPIQQLQKPKAKLTPIKIERKTLEVSKAQHAENTEGPQFGKQKLKKTVAKPKQETATVTLPKFQLKSRIKYVNDWPPQIIQPIVNFLGSVRQNGILSRNIKEAAKIKKKVYKQPELPDIEKTELEKPMFGHEDIIESQKQDEVQIQNDIPKSEEDSEMVKVPEPEVESEDLIEEPDDEPQQFTIKPRRPSVKTSEENVGEITIKKKLKPIRKSSVTLPEITEPETVTFRPKTTKTKEDVEQEFNIQLDSYAEEEISMSSKVKLKPQRQPTFNEEADEASIKFYEENDGPDIVEVIDEDIVTENEPANIMMSLKKPKKPKDTEIEDITSNVIISKPKSEEKVSEIVEDISLKLDRKPKYLVDDQEEVAFDVKSQTEQFTQEELSLSSKIKLKPKKKVTVSEAADEASIQLMQEIEDDSQVEEIILSEADSEENVQMIIKRKPKKPAYEVSEVEELSIEFKPKRINEDMYQEEQLTISAKRQPRKPSQVQGTS